MKRLMVLGAGRGQIRLIEAAKELGYTAIVASIPGNYPGFSYADEICHVDISSPDEVYQCAKRLKIDGIATACLDTGIESVGYVCDKMGLCGLSYQSARISNDKYLMKEAFKKFGVSTAEYRTILSVEDLKRAVCELKFPLIIKAVDLQGSKGIYICNDEQQVFSNYEKVMEETRQDYCIIEEFIQGEVFGAQALIHNGEIRFLLLTGGITFLGDTKIPVGHFVPYNSDDAFNDLARAEVCKAIQAVGLDNCFINLDLIKRNNECFVIELTGRLGANCLPELIQIHYDIPVYQMIAAMAVKDDRIHHMIRMTSDSKRAGLARMLFLEKSGVLASIECRDIHEDYVYEATFFVQPGDKINKFRNAKDCIGQLVVTGNDIDECRKNMQKLCNSVRITLK